jgi:hypothetical protein
MKLEGGRMISYDRTHWEALIDTIIERIGIEAFFEMTAYVIDQRTPKSRLDDFPLPAAVMSGDVGPKAIERHLRERQFKDE